VAFHLFHQFRQSGRVKLFAGSGGYGAGDQRRDFVFVDDVVKVNLDFLDHPGRSGIFNLGTGNAEAFNDVAVATVNACLAASGKPPLTLPEMIRQGAIEYIPFPPQLVGKYQSYTQADLSALRAAGYTAAMLTVAQGVARYVESLISEETSSP